MYRRTGLRVNPYFSVPKMMWLKEHRPQVHELTHKFLGVQDYVAHLLTNRFVTDSSQACRTMLMNINTFSWDEDMLRISGIDRSLLPDLVAPGTAVGGLTKAMAEHSGLRPASRSSSAAAISNAPPWHSTSCVPETLRPTPARAPFVIAYSDKPRFHEDCRTLCSAAAVPGTWIVEAGTFTTGLVHRWFKEQFYPEGAQSYELMNAEAARSPAGAKGVLLIPHFEGSAALLLESAGQRPLLQSHHGDDPFRHGEGRDRGDRLRDQQDVSHCWKAWAHRSIRFA